MEDGKSEKNNQCWISILVSTGGSVVLFSFDVGSERVELSVRSPEPLNNDQWHRVEAEKNIKEAVLQLNGQYREVRPMPPQGHAKLDFYSDLYVGKQHILHYFCRWFAVLSIVFSSIFLSTICSRSS